MVKRFLVVAVIFLFGTLAGWFVTKLPQQLKLLSPTGPTPAPTPLLKYSFEQLRSRQFFPEAIELVEPIATESAYASWLFKFETEEGAVSGQMNIPASSKSNEKFPVIVMLRGYVDKEEYKTGVGTKNAAAVFARNGYVTIAPDFLGYGRSDQGSNDDIEARLVRPATVLQLLASLQNLPQVDTSHVFLWAHSNGGQIALSVLEMSGKDIPTTLWAPVSKPFPYSILYYTDELDDQGKYLRKIISDFEKLYDADQFSIAKYFDWIEAPIQIHQGTADDSVPRGWSDQLVKTLKDQKKDVTYFVYPGADHNLRPSWDTVVARDLLFFSQEKNK